MELFFVSSNKNKYDEIKRYFRAQHMDISFNKLKLNEIQAESLIEIGVNKSVSAYNKTKNNVLVEDDGLFIDALTGFPGAYTSYASSTIGAKGILKLLENKQDRRAHFKSVFVYNDGKTIAIFSGIVEGYITSEITEGGWGFDGIFLPKGLHTTYGELYLQSKKEAYSHRTISLKKFTQWWRYFY